MGAAYDAAAPIRAIYDGLGRERQTQEEATGGGRLITDTFYNYLGHIEQTNNAYLAKGEPQGQLFIPRSKTEVPNSTLYKYDGLGRVTEELPVFGDDPKPDRPPGTRTELTSPRS